MSYVEPIEQAGSSSKKRNYDVPRGRNIDSIFIKLGKLADIIKIINKLITEKMYSWNS